MPQLPQVLGLELREQEVDHPGAHPGLHCGEQGWVGTRDQSWLRTSHSLPPPQAQNAKARGGAFILHSNSAGKTQAPQEMGWQNS